jgi:hypothetical protein
MFYAIILVAFLFGMIRYPNQAGSITTVVQVAHFKNIGSATLSAPQDVVFNGSHIFVSDQNLRGIFVFDLDGNAVNNISGNGNGPGEFNYPTYLALNDTHLFVVDQTNDRIQILDTNLVYADEFGQSGTLSGQFVDIGGIAINATNIFVSDGTNDNIQIFDLDGSYVTNITDPLMTAPTSVSVNNTHIFVANGISVLIFDLAGNYIKSIATSSPYPDMDISETIIVRSHPLNSEVHINDYSGNLLKAVGGPGSGDGEFNYPRGVSVNGPFIFIADQNNHRIQIFVYSTVLVTDVITVTEEETTTVVSTETKISNETITVPGTVTSTVNSTNTFDITITEKKTQTDIFTSTDIITSAKSESGDIKLLLLATSSLLLLPIIRRKLH